MNIIPVILSGGSGTRLWPLSRKEHPKQFLRISGVRTFFQDTVLRCSDPFFDPCPIVVASNDHRFLVAENLHEIGCSAEILLEPVPRNSCAAVIVGCLQAISRDPDATVMIMAADHVIEDVEGFIETCKLAVTPANAGKLVTFGIVPDSPATGYGYIHPGVEDIFDRCSSVNRFVEKPNREKAKQYLAEGYLWNSGNFLFKAKTLLQEARKLVPSIVENATMAHEKLVEDLDFLRLSEADFDRIEAISIDYAIMEKTDRAAVVPALHDWSDIGTWQSVWKQFSRNDDGNMIVGSAKIADGKNNLIHSTHSLTVLNGVSDLVVVTTSDAVLVSSQESSQSVGDLVAELENSGQPEAVSSRKILRPWGSYEVIDEGERYKVKRLEINPGGVLSLQLHKHRSEHWVVVEGCPEITIGEESTIYQPNQSVYIPTEVQHRLANYQDKPAVLIEVQTGDYLGEDDIIRIDDLYNREED